MSAFTSVANNPRASWLEYLGLPEDMDEWTLVDVKDSVSSYLRPADVAAGLPVVPQERLITLADFKHYLTTVGEPYRFMAANRPRVEGDDEAAGSAGSAKAAELARATADLAMVPDVCFQADFELSRPEPVLTKFGFDPQRLANILTGYHNLQETLMGDRNPHKLFFFEIKRNQPVVPVTADGMSTRLARVTQRLTGLGGGTAIALGAQMLRTIFVTWLDSKRANVAERDVISRWMMHSLGTQTGTYTKKRKPRSLVGSGRKKKRTTLNIVELHI